MSNYGHKFEMFLADDLGLGGFVVNSLTWSMSGIKVARESVSKNSHKELSYAGVYFLLCTGRDGLLDSVYIGESLDVKTRLKQHMNDYVKGVEPYALLPSLKPDFDAGMGQKNYLAPSQKYL